MRGSAVSRRSARSWGGWIGTVQNHRSDDDHVICHGSAWSVSLIDLHRDGEPGSALAAVLLEHAVVRVAVGLHVGRGHPASADGTGYAQEGLVESHDIWDWQGGFNWIINSYYRTTLRVI